MPARAKWRNRFTFNFFGERSTADLEDQIRKAIEKAPPDHYAKHYERWFPGKPEGEPISRAELYEAMVKMTAATLRNNGTLRLS